MTAMKSLLWSLVGTALLAALLVLAFRSPSKALVGKTTRLELVARMRSELAAESEAEKSAVLAITDAESQLYADQARARARELERDAAALGPLLQGAERQELIRFSDDFAQLQKVDEQLLALAVQNTNLKASALAFGPAAAAVAEMDGALSRLMAKASDKQILLAAARALAGALRIEALLPPHIAEESDARMDALEATMSKEDEEVRSALAELGPEAESARAAYARFSSLRKQILQLSRENTNVRSLSISLHQKRQRMLTCEASLALLEKTIADEPVPGMPRPR
jgi:hypothetical protein